MGTLIGKVSEKRKKILDTYRALTIKHLQIQETVPISSRSSILSIEPTLNSINSNIIMFLSCGAIYKNHLSISESVKAMLEAIQYFSNGADTRSDSYYESIKFLQSLRAELNKGE